MRHLIFGLGLSLILNACAPDAPQTRTTQTDENEAVSVHPATLAAHKASVKALDFSDRRDFERAEKGFIATFEDGIPAYDPTSYDFISGEAPDTVNPSLWRQSKLLAKHGLFKVSEGIYQVRSFDLSDALNLKQKTVAELRKDGSLKMSGNPLKIKAFFDLIEEPDYWFEIVRP